MPLFGRRKKKKDKGRGATSPEAAPILAAMATAPSPAASSTPPRTQTTVMTVGDSRHVTTTRVDGQGRHVTQTTVKKMTASERQRMPAANAKVPPPPAAVAAIPVRSVDDDEGAGTRAPHPTPAKLPDASRPSANSNSSNAVDMQPPDDLASIDVTRELVKRFVTDIWNRGEIDLIPGVCHPSLRFNGPVGMDRVGHEGFARMVSTVREALTDYHCEIHSMVVESNKAFCRLRFTGKHTGNLLGYPPTGKLVAWMGASEFTCKNGKILKVWELGDVKSLEEQLRSG